MEQKTEKSLVCLIDRCYECYDAQRSWCVEHEKPGAGDASVPKHCHVCGDWIYDIDLGR